MVKYCARWWLLGATASSFRLPSQIRKVASEGGVHLQVHVRALRTFLWEVRRTAVRRPRRPPPVVQSAASRHVRAVKEEIMLDLPRGCFTVTPRTVKEGGASDFFVVPNLLDWASVNGMLVLLRGYDGYDWARTAAGSR